MQKKIATLMVGLALAGGLAHAASNEDATQRYFAGLLAGAEPKRAELTLFMTMMPKGGDLHHHYSGALYAEQYLEWVDKQNYCVDKASYQIVHHVPSGSCLSGAAVMLDNTTLTALLQRWSDKDFHNHGALQSPPDRQFFDTFAYFNDVAATNAHDGLARLKQRAIQENLGYIETIYQLSPMQPDDGFDQQARAGLSDAAMEAFMAKLDQDAGFKQGIASYIGDLKAASAGIDDAQFSMRYQGFVLRFLSPSLVFSSMVSSFEMAMQSPQIVGVNIVGQESVAVSMQDYAMQMRMFKFLKTKYPQVNLALHAGELALGTVPPEGLTFHIRDAIDVAGAKRIGHGIDIAHETGALAIMKEMRDKDIAVEINLTSNAFILGIEGQNHPVTLYRKYGVPFVIATDDAGVSRNNLSEEYVLFASRYKPDYAEVKKLSYNSVKYSFLSKDDKQRMLKSLDVKFATFEAEIAKSNVVTLKH
ncbi:adenosine deaminase [Rugamonas sp.]|uniref:adenosine deaminase family protein n=1 Tax=Rugamonas sp. TaxID=1926287 RepID=UPI0025D3B2D1|nr:adenosine deaminase [Rugamonas sp.]